MNPLKFTMLLVVLGLIGMAIVTWKANREEWQPESMRKSLLAKFGDFVFGDDMDEDY